MYKRHSLDSCSHLRHKNAHTWPPCTFVWEVGINKHSRTLCQYFLKGAASRESTITAQSTAHFWDGGYLCSREEPLWDKSCDRKSSTRGNCSPSRTRCTKGLEFTGTGKARGEQLARVGAGGRSGMRDGMRGGMRAGRRGEMLGIPHAQDQAQPRRTAEKRA